MADGTIVNGTSTVGGKWIQTDYPAGEGQNDDVLREEPL